MCVCVGAVKKTLNLTSPRPSGNVSRLLSGEVPRNGRAAGGAVRQHAGPRSPRHLDVRVQHVVNVVVAGTINRFSALEGF